jgi:hypothetical protein
VRFRRSIALRFPSGSVTSFSCNRLTSTSGAPHFLARVQVSQSELAWRGELSPIPAMRAEILIKTSDRTLLHYLPATISRWDVDRVLEVDRAQVKSAVVLWPRASSTSWGAGCWSQRSGREVGRRRVPPRRQPGQAAHTLRLRSPVQRPQFPALPCTMIVPHTPSFSEWSVYTTKSDNIRT